MRIAYVMLVHKNPRLLKKAIATLSAEDCGFFVHIDRKANIGEFAGARGENVFFSEKRIPVYWGEFSQVEATMRLIQQALSSSTNFEYFVFMQGSDYPLKSGRYIQRFLEENRDAEFMNLVKMPAPGYPLSKINTLRYPSDKPARRFASKVLAKLGLGQRDYRKFLRGLEAYSGDACWVLSRDAAEYIMIFAKANPHVEEYFRNTLTSDEMFFHTILGNSSLRSRIRRNLVYLDWSNHGNHPAMLDQEHVRLFEVKEKVLVENEWGSGEMLFARKFSDDRLDLVERIDEMIKRTEEQSATAL